MDSHSPAYRESWTQCRRLLEQRLAHSPLFAIPLRVIDWAVARGISERSYAWLSHEWLVISNRGWQAERADRLVVIPKPDSVELRLYHDAALTQRADTDQAGLVEELDRLVSGFGQATES
jgi:hypothetical protein